MLGRCIFFLFGQLDGCTCVHMYVIAVLSLKGGVGKTTLATNLAAAAHLRGKSTILVDLDKQGSSLDWGSMRVEASKLAGIAVSKHDRNFSRARLLELATGREVVVLDGPPRIGDQSSAALPSPESRRVSPVHRPIPRAPTHQNCSGTHSWPRR